MLEQAQGAEDLRVGVVMWGVVAFHDEAVVGVEGDDEFGELIVVDAASHLTVKRIRRRAQEWVGVTIVFYPHYLEDGTRCR